MDLNLKKYRVYLPLFIIYIAFGFRIFTNFAFRFIGITPQQVQYLDSLIQVVWCIKVVFGAVINSFDQNYKVVMIISSGIGLIGYLLCSFNNSVIFQITGLILVNVSMVLSDIVVDACMVILNQDTEIDPSEVQPYGWVALYFGIFLGHFVGGFVHDSPYFYYIWMLAPIISLLCAFYLPKSENKKQIFTFGNCRLLFNKRTLILCLFIVISRSAPTYSVGLDLFRKTVGISIASISWSKAVGAILAMFTSFLFKVTLANIHVTLQLVVIQAVLVGLCFLDSLSIQIHQLSLLVGIDCLDQIYNGIYVLIVIIYAMSICPKGFEAIYLSIIMTTYNVGTALSEVFGGITFHFLDIDHSYDSLKYAILIKIIWSVASCITLMLFERRQQLEDIEAKNE